MDADLSFPAVDRRAVLRSTVAAGMVAALQGTGAIAAPQRQTYAVPMNRWVITTERQPWQVSATPAAIGARGGGSSDIEIHAEQRLQVIEGFGACFNEMGWDALSALPRAQQEHIYQELFGDEGAGFSLCRMPVAANDFSRDWYSYDETPGDFALRDFTVANDDKTLVPFIKTALRVRPDLRLWASPWSPPTWMKTNGHYASVPSRPGAPSNGLRPDQRGAEGTDMFIQEQRYFDAYARYFGKFIDAYQKRGIRIEMVMPQNEFNAAQSFPSCCWTPKGLARFIPYLGREMERRGVDVFYGTLERPNERLFEEVYDDAAAAAYIKGVGVQWAGRGALPILSRQHPTLRYYQTEQECGDGKNDWRYARYAWSMMRHYLSNGCGGYEYWNIALPEGGVSRWGWAQNSLVTVDTARRTFRWNHEYYLLKHVAGLVRHGATRIGTNSWTGYEDVLAFRNPDGSIAVITNNPLGTPLPLRIGVGDRLVETTLPPDSFGSVLLG